MNNKQIAALMTKAIQTNAERDSIDHEMGSADPLTQVFRTIMCTLLAALSLEDWAQAMISDLEFKLQSAGDQKRRYQPWLST
jgi:hypothetical protein